MDGNLCRGPDLAGLRDISATSPGLNPELTLNDEGIATYVGGSGTTSLTFSYEVTAGQNAVSLAAAVVDLNGGAIAGLTGDAADLPGRRVVARYR